MHPLETFDREYLKTILAKGRFVWRKHVLQRLAEREIAQNAIIEVLRTGEAIEYYADDFPYPSALYMGVVETRSIHVLVAVDKKNEVAYIITAYEPSLEQFDEGYKKRRPV